MRGDSRQDLYAKIAAVLGLGLLGLSGAIVDYWPVGAPLPAIVPVLPRPALGVARRVDAVLHETPESISASLVRRAALSAPVTSTIATVARPRDASALSDAVVGVAESASSAGPSVVAAEPVSETEVIVAPSAAAIASPADDIESIGAPIVFREASTDAPRDDGFFTSTVKKTGTSLMRTGASIRDAVRTIGVKVRGVFPG